MRRAMINHSPGSALVKGEMQFEERLSKEFGLIRATDEGVFKGSIAAALFRSALPMRPAEVLKALNITEYQLVHLLLSGRLQYPELIAIGKVAWRRDEIEAFLKFEAKFEMLKLCGPKDKHSET